MKREELVKYIGDEVDDVVGENCICVNCRNTSHVLTLYKDVEDCKMPLLKEIFYTNKYCSEHAEEYYETIKKIKKAIMKVAKKFMTDESVKIVIVDYPMYYVSVHKDTIERIKDKRTLKLGSQCFPEYYIEEKKAAHTLTDMLGGLYYEPDDLFIRAVVQGAFNEAFRKKYPNGSVHFFHDCIVMWQELRYYK